MIEILAMGRASPLWIAPGRGFTASEIKAAKIVTHVKNLPNRINTNPETTAFEAVSNLFQNLDITDFAPRYLPANKVCYSSRGSFIRCVDYATNLFVITAKALVESG